MYSLKICTTGFSPVNLQTRSLTFYNYRNTSFAYSSIPNTSLFTNTEESYKLLAHRGLAQTFDISKVEWDTNTAEIIYEPEHGYLENTIASMKAAFDYGADAVELDIQKTKDGQLAVFHDYDLSMRTNGAGNISDYTMGRTKTVRYWVWLYRRWRKKTFPFRGKGIGLMPELIRSIEHFS